jgi:hypothetical protein
MGLIVPCVSTAAISEADTVSNIGMSSERSMISKISKTRNKSKVK